MFGFQLLAYLSLQYISFLSELVFAAVVYTVEHDMHRCGMLPVLMAATMIYCVSVIFISRIYSCATVSSSRCQFWVHPLPNSLTQYVRLLFQVGIHSRSAYRSCGLYLSLDFLSVPRPHGGKPPVPCPTLVTRQPLNPLPFLFFQSSDNWF